MKWDYFFIWLASKANHKKKGLRHNPMDVCLNCQFKLEKDQYFCPNCGQKVHHSKLSVGSLFAEFFGSIFNIDNGIYRSLMYLPVPAYLSKKFINGKRKRYLNPVRFFLLTLILHVAVITNIIPFEDISRSTAENIENIGKQELFSEFSAQKPELQEHFGACDIDTLGTIIFGNRNTADDTLTIFDFNQSSADSPINRFINNPKFAFRTTDMLNLPIDTFLVRYNAQTPAEKVIMSQIVRTFRDPPGAMRFGIGNLIWSVLSAILLVALLMKLLYIRRKRYLVEHLIVLFNVHSFAFILASIALYIWGNFLNFEGAAHNWAYLAIAIFFFLSIKRYYGQGWFKSFIKFAMIGVFYFISLVFMIVLVFVISLFFFK